MAYAPHFYTPDNIVGYTGDVRHYPTIYYKSGYEYGRITTRHRFGFNVGRDFVKFNPYHTIQNQMRGGKLTSVEVALYPRGTEELHVSRNAFIPRSDISEADMQYLIVWAMMHPEQKTVYAGAVHQARAEKQASEARHQIDLKAQMQAEMKARFALAAQQNANPNRRGGVRLDNAQRVIGGAQGRTWG